jgi:predicted Rdx family selenoprotein
MSARNAASVGSTALSALQFGWGTAYEIGADEEGYWARRRDGLGGKITADAPDELREQIRADYDLKHVSREFAPAEEP